MATIHYLMKTGHTGGDYVNQCHVASLTRHGWKADVWRLPNKRRKPRHRLFHPLLKRNNVDDIFVVSEGDMDLYAELAGHRRLIQHNQAPYYTFGPWPDATALNKAAVEAILTPSHHARTVLQDNGIRKPVHVVRPFIDPMFRPADKVPCIAYNPRKHAAASRFVMGSLKSRYPHLKDIAWIPLDNLPRQEVANQLSKALIYASFAELESLGLLSLEAMRSGCRVIGYKGQGGQEYASADNGLWLDEGDPRAFVDALARTLEGHDAQAWPSRLEAGTATAASFSQARFDTELSAAWEAIMGRGADTFRI